jgi:hypothetical protein
MATVLCVGADSDAATQVLQSAGHDVISASTAGEVARACTFNLVDVAVIGQEMSFYRQRELFALVRLYSPATKILSLAGAVPDRILPSADDWLEAHLDVHRELSERVALLSS